MSAVQLYVPVFQSLARTATPTPATFNDVSHTRLGGHFVIDATAIGAAPSVVFNIEAQDPLSQKWYALLVSAAITAVGTTRLSIYPGVPPVANVSASDFIPPIWRVRPVHGNADSITYSVSANLRN